MTEIAGLLVDRVIVPMPAQVPEFLGVSGFRGQILPVYCLNTMLGHTNGKHGRWLVLARSEETLALNFDDFDGYTSIAQSDIVPADRAKTRNEFVREVANVPGDVRPIVSVTALSEEIKRRHRRTNMPKEVT
jgi:chemotaxis signal transduction protein